MKLPVQQAERTAGRALVSSLVAHGVERVFCVPGESYLEVLDALKDVDDQIDLIVTKHEGAAANMAEADGKLTGKPGICMVTRGPGATHASIGLHIAQQDSTPMILFVGQIARNHRGREAFQEMDYSQFFGSVAKLVIEIDDPHRVPELLARAFNVAVSGRPGPVVVSLPEDMLTAMTAAPDCEPMWPQTAEVGATTREQVAAALQSAQRPLVIVGGSNWSAQACADLRGFAETWNLPVACSFRRQDLLDNENPQYVGHMSLGMSPALRTLAQEADLIIAIGTRLGDVPTDGYTLFDLPTPKQKLIHFHPSLDEIGRVFRPDLAIQATSNAALHALVQLQPSGDISWGQRTAQARKDFVSFTSRRDPQPALNGVDLTEVMLHLNEALPDDAILTNGAGNYAVWLHRYYRYRTSRTELASTCGAMGYGLPAAVAASLRVKGQRPVVCVAGDGCFMMYPQEIATAVEFGAPLIVLIVNNGMYGTIRMHQEREYPGRVSGTRIRGSDYVALAASMGAYAERVENAADFPQAFERARATGGVAVLELLTDPLQITPDKRFQA